MNITFDFFLEFASIRSVCIYPEVANHQSWSFSFQSAICIFPSKNRWNKLWKTANLQNGYLRNLKFVLTSVKTYGCSVPTCSPLKLRQTTCLRLFKYSTGALDCKGNVLKNYNFCSKSSKNDPILFKMGYEVPYMFVYGCIKVFFEKWIFEFFKAKIINFALKNPKK